MNIIDKELMDVSDRLLETIKYPEYGSVQNDMMNYLAYMANVNLNIEYKMVTTSMVSPTSRRLMCDIRYLQDKLGICTYTGMNYILSPLRSSLTYKMKLQSLMNIKIDLMMKVSHLLGVNYIERVPNLRDYTSKYKGLPIELMPKLYKFK